LANIFFKIASDAMIRGFGEEKYARKARGQKSRDPNHLGFRLKAKFHAPIESCFVQENESYSLAYVFSGNTVLEFSVYGIPYSIIQCMHNFCI
jgi:hypothetical protein